MREEIWCERKMWASAEGGAPEVNLETSMGSFTVEVLQFSPSFYVLSLRS